MLHLNVLQNQWIMLALVMGAVLILALALWLVAYWRPRDGETARHRSPVPWILILTFAFCIIYVIVYTLMLAANPPNW
jgi:hypothetical protein